MYGLMLGLRYLTQVVFGVGACNDQGDSEGRNPKKLVQRATCIGVLDCDKVLRLSSARWRKNLALAELIARGASMRGRTIHWG
mmetsp:Transcript_3386/g.5483  ORF Transcript_3386/g.5483 Transcript_3386/m.5483 type:complete len:83 (-) Transcript_3386:214-462(-)